MNRSPLFYPLNRTGDADAGGAADLQTDIMRFMAILAMCLVAVFALVQSIPLAPATLETTPHEDSATRAEAPRVAPDRRMEKPPENPQAPASEPPSAEPASAATASTDNGFTLRFESDAALLRLVAGQVIGLYAIGSGWSLRMRLKGSEIEFGPASIPNQYHEMEPDTVPAAVIEALGETSAARSPGAFRWAVTLPPKLRRELEIVLTERDSGTLIIGAAGSLRLEQ